MFATNTANCVNQQLAPAANRTTTTETDWTTSKIVRIHTSPYVYLCLLPAPISISCLRVADA